MSEGPTAAGAARRVGSGTTRIVRAWKALPGESRLAAYASIGLFLTLFLPWYQLHFFVVVGGHPQPAADSQTGWGAFSFVEAAVLVVAAGVLVLLFERAEGRAFHLPGGDGGVITAAGIWTCVLVVWRIFDKQGATSHGTFVTSYGIEWGIFVALGAAAFLAYAGSRIRAGHRPEPPLPGENSAPAGSSAAATTTVREPTTTVREAAPRRQSRARARTRTPVPPRRRPRTPPPAPEDRPSPKSPPDRPRHRPSAAELFERVVPEDPPTMRFGRTKPADVDTTLRMGSNPPPDETTDATPPDQQLTMPLGNDDDTLPLDRKR